MWLIAPLFCSIAAATEAAPSAFVPYEAGILDRLLSFVGIFAFVGVAWLMSEHRSRINWRTIGWGIGLQLIFGAVVLSPAVSEIFYTVVNGGVARLLDFANEGSAFVFQTIHPHQSDALNFGTGEFERVTYGFSDRPPENMNPAVKTFAFVILPTIIFFSALMSMLYYLNIMQRIVKVIAWVMVRTLGTSGAESLSAAGNIFVGQTEAPLLIRPFVDGMTRSELMAVMTGGFATVAGGVLGAYVAFLNNSIPNIAGHLVIASIISAPAALAIAKVIVPETEESQTAGEVKVAFEKNGSNLMEAIANGATDGMKLVLNVAAMLIAIVAIVAMVNWFVGAVPVRFCGDAATFGYAAQCADATVTAVPLTLSDIMGWLFFPFAFLMGVPLQDCSEVGRLLGKKIVLTEFLAYIDLGAMLDSPVPVITERSAVIASYALCGFANFASIGIQLGGIGGIAPKRMGELASLGFKAMIGGAIAACMTGAVAGLFL
jgi:CNT family concentrative nucleoside transporter